MTETVGFGAPQSRIGRIFVASEMQYKFSPESWPTYQKHMSCSQKDFDSLCAPSGLDFPQVADDDLAINPALSRSSSSGKSAQEGAYDDCHKAAVAGQISRLLLWTEGCHQLGSSRPSTAYGERDIFSLGPADAGTGKDPRQSSLPPPRRFCRRSWLGISRRLLRHSEATDLKN